MKRIVFCLFVCVCIGVLAAGCTAPPVTQPVSTPIPPTTVVSTPVPTTAPVTDAALVGTWYLKAMTGPGGANPVQTMNVQITAVFTAQGAVGGSGGCNNYNGDYTLTGQVTPNGNGITIGPLITTLMYCADKSNTEQTYLQILQNAVAYTVNTNNQLTITSSAGNLLVYEKAPYGPTSVPIGV
jgi:heat shock protein HslJ